MKKKAALQDVKGRLLDRKSPTHKGQIEPETMDDLYQLKRARRNHEQKRKRLMVVMRFIILLFVIVFLANV